MKIENAKENPTSLMMIYLSLTLNGFVPRAKQELQKSIKWKHYYRHRLQLCRLRQIKQKVQIRLKKKNNHQL